MNLQKNKVIIAVACVIALLALVTVFLIFNGNQDDVQEVIQETTIGTSSTTVATTTTTTTTTTTVTTVTTTEEVTTTEATTTEEVTTTPAWSYTTHIKKDTVMKYNSINPDCKGWIYLDDSVIDYPIMQSTDNSFYVSNNWQGNASSSGSIMLDYECTIGQTMNTIIYGHNMGNGSMFHQIKSYKDESWWLNHQYIEVSDLETIYVYQIFSVDVLYGRSDASFTYWLEPNKSLADEDTYNSFVDNVISKRYTSVGIEAPSYPTGILTLQTCNSGQDDGMRCVAFGKLVATYDLQ
ncbi:MAG: class B sortase [Ruminococcus sp.]|nr:class B sortase [Ruminococcus sp.]